MMHRRVRVQIPAPVAERVGGHVQDADHDRPIEGNLATTHDPLAGWLERRPHEPGKPLGDRRRQRRALGVDQGCERRGPARHQRPPVTREAFHAVPRSLGQEAITVFRRQIVDHHGHGLDPTRRRRSTRGIDAPMNQGVLDSR